MPRRSRARSKPSKARSEARSKARSTDDTTLGFPVSAGWDWHGDGNVTPMPKGGKREPLPPAKGQVRDYGRERLVRMYRALPFKEFEKDRRRLKLHADTAKYDAAFAKAYAWLLPGLKDLRDGQHAT